jgi:hypothetical protein
MEDSSAPAQPSSQPRKANIKWNFVRTHADRAQKENFYNKEKLDRERLRVGNKQVRSSYLDCRVDGCPFRIKFVEDITGCIHEYSTEDARAQHSEAAHDEEVDDDTNKGYYLNTYITIQCYCYHYYYYNY